MDYDYRAGKERIKDILKRNIEIEEKRTVPSENEFTYENAYQCWITSIFVDIRKSTELFNSSNKKNISKIIRSFTSEIIEILNDVDNAVIEEIGIRGDCVYAIYSTPTSEMFISLFKFFNHCFYI